MADTPIGVAQLTRLVAARLADFGPLLVEGEVSGSKIAPSGHWYATLKDGDAVLSVAMWRSSVVRAGPLPRDGTRVQVRGSLEVYAPRGSYQLIATRIAAVGAGDLLARLERLKAALAAEGLFDEDRKRDLPLLPRAVGLATAAGSAALADMLDSIRARFPTMPVVHAPCLVQGPGAAASIVAALARLQAHPEVEVIVCGRGGGSLEDLWAFNEEPVVRALAACRVPVISAVGHETDWTLADLAADRRAKTPTAAGEVVVPVLADLRAALAAHRDDLDDAIDGALARTAARIAALASHRALAEPGHRVERLRQRLDDAQERLAQAGGTVADRAAARIEAAGLRLAAAHPERRLADRRQRLDDLAGRLARSAARLPERSAARLAECAGRLHALSPLGVIGRGYSVLRTGDGRVVRSTADAPPGSELAARTGDGWLTATVTGARRQRLDEPDEPYRA